MKNITKIILIILALIGILIIANSINTLEPTLTPQECEEKGGRNLNIVAGDTCEEHEKNIGEVVGFISPNICCVPLIGAGCGTVNPDNRDECCYRKFREEGYPKCLGLRIFYNLEKTKCDFTCGNEPIACTEDARECPDKTWTSRTSVLNCKFIPCGYN